MSGSVNNRNMLSNQRVIVLLPVCVLAIITGLMIAHSQLSAMLLLAGITLFLLTWLVFSKAYVYVLIHFAMIVLVKGAFPWLSDLKFTLPDGLVINIFGGLNGLMIVFLIIYTVIKKRNWFKYPLGKILIGLWILATVSLILSVLLELPIIEQGVRKWVTLGNWISAYFLILDSVKTRRDAIYSIIGYIIIIGVLAISVLLPGETHTVKSVEYGLQRFGGFKAEPASSGDSTAMASIVCIAWLLTGGIRKYWYMVIPLILCIRALILTMSRMPIIALSTASIFLLWNSKKILSWKAMILVCVVIYLFISNERFDYTNLIRGQIDYVIYTNYFGRLSAWKLFLAQMTPLSFIIGNGIGCTSYVAHAMHNAYLRFLYEFGVGGLLLLVAVIVKAYIFVREIYRKTDDTFVRKTALAAMGIIIMIGIIQASIDAPFSDTYYNFVFLGGVVLGSPRWSKWGTSVVSQ